MSALTGTDFVTFFREVHGHDPFPWQRALADQVVNSGWPGAIDVPTGLGKTSAIDIAVFTMALGRSRPPRRVFFCIDRRVVVDEAFRHAMQLKEKLEQASPGSVVARVASALRSLAPDIPDVLEVARMRGGVTWAARWLDRVDVPAVVVGTVDQLGSRVFFRGYGVTHSARPIDAALVGTDSLVLLDEAHLAAPFLTTLHDAMQFDRSVLPLAQPHVVTLSATQSAGQADVLPFDVDAHLAEEESARRITAGKRLVVLRSAAKAVTEVLAAAAEDLAAAAPNRIVVVCNTVNRAREVFTRLRARFGDDTWLLTGRNRSIDRERIQAEVLARFGSARPDRPIILVATQTIEVGVNLDFDGLVTEAAAADAIIQRLGRLNRFGRSPLGVGRAVLVASDRPDTDPVYGGAADQCAAWFAEWCGVHDATPKTATDVLARAEGGDVSPLALRQRLASAPPDAFAEAAQAPLLAPGILDTWARTSPVPDPDVPVAPYLHGVGRDSATVSLVWRVDVTEEDLASGNVDPAYVVQPASDEQLDVPLSAARQWLGGAAATPVSDVDGLDRLSAEEVSDGRLALRWDSAEDLRIVSPRELRPGDVLIVPTTYGGLDEWGWAPTSADPVLDVSDVVDRRGFCLVRLTQRALAQAIGDAEASALSATITTILEADGSAREADVRDLMGAVRAVLGSTTPTWFASILSHALQTDDGLRIASVLAATPEGDLDVEKAGVVVRVPAQRGSPQANRAYESDDATVLATSSTSRTVSLEQHLDAVGQEARAVAERLGLPSDVVNSVGLAARWHDLGKADPRFQAMLHQSTSWSPGSGDLLAKSGMDPSNRVAMRAALRVSGYPRGMRHEALSTRLAARALAETTREDADIDLVLHLIASHHGRGRPLVEPVEDLAPPPVVVRMDGHVMTWEGAVPVDWAAPARFARLQQRYGRWGLALLETVVRLADMACSARGT